MKKKLIINPKKNEIQKEGLLLNFTNIFGNLLLKVYQQDPSKDFTPIITKEGHLRRFVSNVDPVRVAIQDYAGKEIKSIEEGAEFLTKVGDEIYGKGWYYKLIINEVKYDRCDLFYMETPNEDIVKKLTEGLDGIAEIQYNKPKGTKKNKSDADTESEAATTSSKEQEK